MIAIARRELVAYFSSLLAYVVIALFLGVTGFYFYSNLSFFLLSGGLAAVAYAYLGLYLVRAGYLRKPRGAAAVRQARHGPAPRRCDRRRSAPNGGTPNRKAGIARCARA